MPITAQLSILSAEDCTLVEGDSRIGSALRISRTPFADRQEQKLREVIDMCDREVGEILLKSGD